MNQTQETNKAHAINWDFLVLQMLLLRRERVEMTLNWSGQSQISILIFWDRQLDIIPCLKVVILIVVIWYIEQISLCRVFFSSGIIH